jgi:nucleoside-diphosphate-sugar epimerase
MQIFLTGATGYIGTAVLDALIRAGHDVTALVRRPAGAEPLRERRVSCVVGDLGDPTAWRDAAVGFDAYVHTAFESSPRGAEVDRVAVTELTALARAAKSTLVYTSGVWVLGNTRRPAAEDAPLDPPPHVAFRPAHEKMVLASTTQGVRAIVVRPGIVYGGARGIVSDLLRDAENGLMRVIGNGQNHWPHVYDRDLADLYARLLGDPETSGVYHANDEADETVGDIVEAIAAQAGSRPDVRFVPIDEARRKLGTYADALALDQIVRSPRARALGWQPTLGSVGRSVRRLFEERRSARAATAH